MEPRIYPIGIMPETIWKVQRFQELKAVIERYLLDDLPIYESWVIEYNKLHKELNNK